MLTRLMDMFVTVSLDMQEFTAKRVSEGRKCGLFI